MSEEKSRKILQAMWDKVARPGSDGRKYIVIRNRQDLEYHYWSGFVDDGKYTLSQWVEAFADSLLPNGAYLVTEDQWRAKVLFHYSGPVDAPFDPMTLRDGEWTEEELMTVVWEKLKPSVCFSKEEFAKIIEEVKKSIPRSASSHYLISSQLKKDWLEFLNTYPSPRRVLEMGLAQLKASQSLSSGEDQKSGTAFSKGPTPSRQVADRLSQIIAKREK